MYMHSQCLLKSTSEWRRLSRPGFRVRVRVIPRLTCVARCKWAAPQGGTRRQTPRWEWHTPSETITNSNVVIAERNWPAFRGGESIIRKQMELNCTAALNQAPGAL